LYNYIIVAGFGGQVENRLRKSGLEVELWQHREEEARDAMSRTQR
jgi:hypothetical protein